MNNEKYNQIIDEVHRNYSMSCIKETKKQEREMKEKGGWNTLCLEPYFESKEKFIGLIKTDPEFSERWGLKIEERELSLEERGQWCEDFLDWDLIVPNLDHDHIREDVEENAPTKLITITYKDETIEIYE
jgi:hypothetical protein